jgi:hypothetical protein
MKVVYLNDEKLPYEEAQNYFDEAAAWASRQCPSYIDYDVQDVSDVTLVCDQVAQYRFKDPKDALLFELKWR